MTNKRSGGGRELFSSKKMPPDVNDIINSYLDPVYALNSKNPLYTIETSIGNDVILLSEDVHFGKWITLCRPQRRLRRSLSHECKISRNNDNYHLAYRWYVGGARIQL